MTFFSAHSSFKFIIRFELTLIVSLATLLERPLVHKELESQRNRNHAPRLIGHLSITLTEVVHRASDRCRMCNKRRYMLYFSGQCTMFRLELQLKVFAVGNHSRNELRQCLKTVT